MIQTVTGSLRGTMALLDSQGVKGRDVRKITRVDGVWTVYFVRVN